MFVQVKQTQGKTALFKVQAVFWAGTNGVTQGRWSSESHQNKTKEPMRTVLLG